MVREGLGDLMLNQFIFTCEDALRAVHAASVAGKKLVLASVIIDIENFSVSILRYLDIPRRFAAVMNEYYPELADAITIVNAPFGFETAWKVVSLLLDPTSRKKVRILGKDFSKGLEEHSHVDTAVLPPFLGGKADASELPQVLPVPRQAGAGLDLSFTR